MKNKLLILPLLLIFLVFGCKNSLIQTDDIVTAEYGSLSIGDTTESRALKIDKILGAKVSVSGYEFNDNDLSRETSITDGRVSGVKIERIPVGKNRIVTVQAAKKASSIGSGDFIDGVVMRAVTDINAGGNAVDVNWSSTALGNVFYELMMLKYNISEITAEQKTSIANAIPTNVHATLVNTKAIAEDFKSGSLKDKSTYALKGATVKFDVEGTTYDNYIVQVTDPASNKNIKVQEREISGITAGTWDLVVWTDDTFKFEWYREGHIPVEEGDVIELAEPLKFATPKPEILPKNMFLEKEQKISIEFASGLGITVYYTTDGTEPTTSSPVYTGPFKFDGDTTVVKAFAVTDGNATAPSAVVTREFYKYELGSNYPDSGSCIPVDQDKWGSANYELGATVNGNDVEFAVYSANATKMLLEIYDTAYGEDAAYDYWMVKGSDNVWRAKVAGIGAGTLYAFRAWGPNWDYNPSWKRGNSEAGFVSDCDYDSNGNRFNPNKVLFDPYAKEISHDKSHPDVLGLVKNATGSKGESNPSVIYSTGDTNKVDGKPSREFDTGKYAPKAIVVDDNTDFGTKPEIPQENAIIYEAHARGLTKHSSSANLETILKDIKGFEAVKNIPTEYHGTYKGVAMMVPYLKALGVNTIELLPVHESDNDGNPDEAPGGNYWAYMTYGYFAPDRRYSSDKSYGGPTKEFKEMVAAFHEAGMEVYLDVVFNHSGEGGPWYGDKDSYNTAELTFMRGLDNSTYYCLSSDKKGYWETTGCGNNLQCDNPTVRQLILDSLTYWIDEMGVDGFRFDLAPVLGREKSGSEWVFSQNATTINNIVAPENSKNAEMIAEAWDTQWPGGYQVGNFPDGWGEWNGRYRDAMRNFVGNGNWGQTGDYIYGDKANFIDQGGPHKSVNFIVAHDGFTLADLSSGYGQAGNDYNKSMKWPFGPSDGGNGDGAPSGFLANTTDEKASKRQTNRNYIAIQMMSRGVPMIVWGDEFSRTQNGNNNPYNIDSVATWSNYNMISTASPHTVSTGYTGEKQQYHNNFGTFGNYGVSSADTDGVNGNFMFMKYMLNLRANEPALNQDNYTSVAYTYSSPSSYASSDVMIHIDGSTVPGGSDYLLMMNMTGNHVDFPVQSAEEGKEWVRIVDTQKHFETDFNCWDLTSINTATISGSYGVTPWSVVIFKEVAARERASVPVMSGFNADSNGDYEGSTTVTISTSTSDADIYYTIDGSSPTLNNDGTVRNGTKYTSPFEITQTTIVKALAYKQGELPSAVVTKKFTNTAVVETPVLSVPAGDFWNTITVFVTGDTAGATYYYTTDGSVPTTSSNLYSASTGIKIDANTNLKVVGIKSGLANAYAEATYTKQENKTYTENKSGVILQGFNWDSAPRGDGYNAENPSPKWYKWYGVMQKYASEIKDRFEYVWFPPASKTDTSSSEGYAPTELNDLNSCYGTEAELKATIEKISPAKAIADIVVNHRAGTSDWGDFTNPKWTDDYYSITSDDEFNTSNKGATDTGMGYEAYRDLDHTNTAVQQGIYSWMNSVLKRVGFVGWRYDYVKGFAGDYVGYYNAMSDAAFSVGEYWPDSGTWTTLIDNWISATENSVNGQVGKKSRAFDFVLKDKMNSAFGWFKSGGDDKKTNWDLSLLADTTTLMRSNPSAAVTFVDNHDTGSTQQHWELDPGDVHVAYAYILTHPGMPCVASQHYFAEDGWQYRGAEIVPDTEFTMKQHIDYLIQIRQDVGIEYDDTVTVLDATETNYAAKIVGTKGEIVVKIGGDMWSPTGEGYDGNYPIYSGSNFAIWQKGNKGVAPVPVDLTISAPDWIWSDNAVLYAWVWGGEYGEGQWVKATGSSTTINLTIKNDAKGFLFARCSQGTTTPDWALKGGSAAGRIYNKSTDVTLVKGQTEYSVASFTEYPEIYLNPGVWNVDGARFAVYFFDNSVEKNEWVSMTYNENKKLYQVVSPSSHNYPNLIFCRMNPDAENEWGKDKVWNQSADLTLDGTTYVIGGDWENPNHYWE